MNSLSPTMSWIVESSPLSLETNTPVLIILKTLLVFVFVWILIDQLDLRGSFKLNPHPVAHGPWRLPVIGNTHQILYHYYNRLEYFLTLRHDYGDVFRFDLLGTRGTFVSTPELVEYVLKTNFINFVKGPLFQTRMMTLLGHGIFNADGTSWRTQRKTASHMFNVRTMRDHMSGVFVSHGRTLVRQLSEISNAKHTLEIQDLYFRYTLDAIGQIAFGVDFGSLESREPPAFARAFDQANRTCEFRFLNPVWKLSQVFLPSEHKCRENMRFLKAFSAEIIQTRRRELKKDLDKTPDVLSRFIDMRNEKGEPYSDDYIQDVLLNFILAGRDTTANALAWTTYELCRHPQVQVQVQDELDEVLQQAEPDFESVKDLEVLHRVCLEALRLHPSVPIELKTVVNDDVLPSGHLVKAGEMLAFLPYVLNRNPEIYPDPHTFRPQRWAEMKPNAYQYPTFNAGPRTCLGQNMALLEMKILLSMILQHFSLTLAPDQNPKVTYAPTITLPIQGGLHIAVVPRELK